MKEQERERGKIKVNYANAATSIYNANFLNFISKATSIRHIKKNE